MNAVGEAKDKAVGAKDEAQSFWKTQRANRPWLDHAVRAYQQLGNTNGTLLAGALTFISFLSIIPLLLLAVSIAAAVLKSHPETLYKLIEKIQEQAPGGLGKTLKTTLNSAIKNAGSLGVVGVISVALTGLGWVANLRTATEQVWEHPPLKRNFVKAKIADLFVLAGLGLGLLLSVALTVVGSALTGPIIDLLSFSGSAVVTVLARVIGIGVALLADMLILGFLLIRLPRADVPRGTAIRAAVLAAVGLEILKLIGAYYIKSVSSSPTAVAFGGLVGVLVFLNLVFRFLLYCTAWTATGTPNDPLAASDLVPTPDSGASKTADPDAPHSQSSIKASGRSDRPAPPTHSRGVALALTIGALARKRKAS
jgi:membrane protein